MEIAGDGNGNGGTMASYRDILMRTCIASLERFYVPDAGLFARSVAWDGAAWTRTDASPNHTANALLALYQLRRCGIATSIDPDRMIQRLMRDHFDDLDYTGLAFLLWADSIGDHRHGARLWGALCARLPAFASNTMHLGWTLSSLCHHVRVAAAPAPVERLAGELHRRLAANHSEKSGLFYDSGARDGWLRHRKPVSTFSSQIYAIHALALYGRVFGVAEARARASRCAAAICRRQGPEGQWWWRYDVESGAVVEKYPVYAVNQDSAVPMALGELQRALGNREHEECINRSLGWVFGHNELRRLLVDESAGVIWRAIRSHQDQFEVVPEMHSYHSARCLYAWCTARPEVGSPGGMVAETRAPESRSATACA